MNYSETYFELDSEEATHCHHCHLISCVYIKGHMSIHCSKDQSNACMCENDVEGVERSLNSFNCYSCYSSRKSRKWCLWLLHNTVYTVMLLILLMSKGSKVYSVYRAPCPSRGEGYLFEPSALWGLVVHHQSVRGGSFVNFLGLVNYKSDCRQDAQPIPNS